MTGTTIPESPYARARARGSNPETALCSVAKDSRSRALISSNLGRPRRRPFLRRTFCRPCAPSLASRSHEQPVRYPCVKPVGSLSGPVTSGEGRLQVHFAQWGESVGGTKSHPTRARGSDQETALAEPRRLHPKRQRRRRSRCSFVRHAPFLFWPLVGPSVPPEPLEGSGAKAV